MLRTIPVDVNRASRAVTLRHPNSIDCVLYRKVIKRTADMQNGMQLIGGIPELSSEEVSEYDWTELGEGRILFTKDSFSDSTIVTQGDAYNAAEPGFFALIAPLAKDNSETGYFEPKMSDVVSILMGAGIAINYEVVHIPTPIGIPTPQSTYTPRYLLQKRDDLPYTMIGNS